MVLCIHEICLKLELCCGTICIQTPYIYYACSKLILFNTQKQMFMVVWKSYLHIVVQNP